MIAEGKITLVKAGKIFLQMFIMESFSLSNLHWKFSQKKINIFSHSACSMMFELGYGDE